MMEGQVKKSLKLSCYMILSANNESPKNNHISLFYMLITVSGGKRGKLHLIPSGKGQAETCGRRQLIFKMYFSMN
jgi:hypothetical protein